MFKICINAQFTAVHSSGSYHLLLTDNDEISVMLCLSYSASDGIFFAEILLLNALLWSRMELSIKKAIKRLSICEFSYKRALQTSTVYAYSS